MGNRRAASPLIGSREPFGEDDEPSARRGRARDHDEEERAERDSEGHVERWPRMRRAPAWDSIAASCTSPSASLRPPRRPTERGWRASIASFLGSGPRRATRVLSTFDVDPLRDLERADVRHGLPTDPLLGERVCVRRHGDHSRGR